jgi:hypothetical protein
MTTDEGELARRYRQATAAASRRDCPSGETLARAAAGDLSPAEREQVVDHLAGCSDCAEEYRLATSLEPWAADAGTGTGRQRITPWLSGLAAAAVVAISTSAGLWSYFELRRSRVELERATELARRSAEDTAGLRREVAQLAQPQINVVIADVFPPDATRGERGSDGEPTIVVPADARLFTVILNSSDAAPPNPSGYTLEVLNDGGSLVWRGAGLQRSRFGTFTVALPRTLLPAGRYRLVLRAPDPNAAPAGSRIVHEYPLHIRYE